MHIVSADWVYLKNKSISGEHCLLIEGSLITDILKKSDIDKRFKKIKKIEYQNAIIMPSLAEGFLNLESCESLEEKNSKINNLISHGITNLQIYSSSYHDLLNCKLDSHVNYRIVVELDGLSDVQSKINEMNKDIDFYKMNPNIIFSVFVKNLTNFNREMLTKVVSILNEINIGIIIDIDELNRLNQNKLDDLLYFLDEINFFNNIVCGLCSNLENTLLDIFKKRNLLLLIPQKDIKTLTTINKIKHLIDNKVKFMIVIDDDNFYDPYSIMKFLMIITNQKSKNKFSNAIYDFISSNGFDIFSKFTYKGIIQKRTTASFNIFQYNKDYLIKSTNDIPSLYRLDKRSLIHVWSAGKIIYSMD